MARRNKAWIILITIVEENKTLLEEYNKCKNISIIDTVQNIIHPDGDGDGVRASTLPVNRSESNNLGEEREMQTREKGKDEASEEKKTKEEERRRKRYKIKQEERKKKLKEDTAIFSSLHKERQATHSLATCFLFFLRCVVWLSRWKQQQTGSVSNAPSPHASKYCLMRCLQLALQRLCFLPSLIPFSLLVF